MKLETTIKLKVSNIEVNDGYYSFDYESVIDGKKKKGSYDSDFDSQSSAQFRKVLENGYAVEQALAQALNL